MKRNNKSSGVTPAKEIAYIAVTCAILIGAQYALSFVAGVEIVTLILVCFSYVFGIRRGVICALAFSLLRCALFGFYPTAVILYLIYYPALCAIFGAIGNGDKNYKFEKFLPLTVVLVNVLLVLIAVFCGAAAGLDLIKVSKLWKITINILLWTVFSVSSALLIAFNTLVVLSKRRIYNGTAFIKLIFITTTAAFCTICFTLLDDVITPLTFGYSLSTALVYFYSSFTAMLPQTVCAIVTVFTLFYPVTAALKRAAKL